jgi:hypothetical protein
MPESAGLKEACNLRTEARNEARLRAQAQRPNISFAEITVGAIRGSHDSEEEHHQEKPGKVERDGIHAVGYARESNAERHGREIKRKEEDYGGHGKEQGGQAAVFVRASSVLKHGLFPL